MPRGVVVWIGYVVESFNAVNGVCKWVSLKLSLEFTLTSTRSVVVGLFSTVIFTLRKFQAKNWYQFSHCVIKWYQYVTDFIPIFFICERNMHVVKFHVAIMQIPHIDKVPHKAAAFYIGTHSIVRSHTQLYIKMRFFTCVNYWYQFFS